MKLSGGAVQPAVIATDGSLSIHIYIYMFTYGMPALDSAFVFKAKKNKMITFFANVVVYLPLFSERKKSAAEPFLYK